MARRILLDELLASPASMDELREALGRGGVAAIPTETFYGLAASPFDADACARVVAMKGRPAQKALPVLAASRDDFDVLGVEASPESLARFSALWPAPLTVVFAVRAPLPCTAGETSLAVRVPAHAGLRRLLAATGPLTGTSANVSGESPLSNPDRVEEVFGAAVDFVVDGGESPGGQPSTIVDARVTPPRRIRPGAFPWPETR